MTCGLRRTLEGRALSVRVRYHPCVIVLEKAPSTLLVALFLRGFWLEVRLADDGSTVLARYVYGERQIARVLVGRA